MYGDNQRKKKPIYEICSQVNIARIRKVVKVTVKHFATHGFNCRIDSSQSKSVNVDDQFYNTEVGICNGGL